MGLAEGPGELHRKQSFFPGSGEGHSKSAAKAGFGLRQEENMLERVGTGRDQAANSLRTSYPHSTLPVYPVFSLVHCSVWAEKHQSTLPFPLGCSKLLIKRYGLSLPIYTEEALTGKSPKLHHPNLHLHPTTCDYFHFHIAFY